MKKPFDLNADYQPASFTFADQKQVQAILARYPDDRARSGIMPLLDLAQRQVATVGAKASPPFGGWIPRAAMDDIARICGVDPIKVYEVATFYSMYNLAPVGKYLVQFCTTTPCWLCGSSKILAAAESHLGIHMGQTTPDNMFTLIEVECLGACVNGPMIQVNDDYYEDLTPENIVILLDDLQDGRRVSVGSQRGRKGSQALSGPTTLLDRAG
ncbi:MAG: NAD(P)H-dependent oxidoreductase subunit E [Pseudomonadota bacterium]